MNVETPKRPLPKSSGASYTETRLSETPAKSSNFEVSGKSLLATSREGDSSMEGASMVWLDKPVTG